MADGNYILKFDADVSGVNRAIETLGTTAQGVFTRIQTAQAAAVSGSAAVAPTGQVNLPTATAASAGGRALIPGSKNLFGDNALQNFRELQQELANLPAFFPPSGQPFLGQTIEEGLGGLPTRTASGALSPQVQNLLETRIQQIVGESGAVLGPRGGALRGEQLVNAQNDARSFLNDQILREANEISRGTRLEATARQRSDQLGTRVAELKSEEIRESERGLAKTRELSRIDDRLAVLDDPSLEEPRRQAGLREQLDRNRQQILNAQDPLIQATEDEVAQLRRDRQGRQKIQALQDPLTQAINDEVAGINVGNRTRQRLQQLQDPLLTAQRRQLDIAAERDRLDRERFLIADDTISSERDANAIIKQEDRLRRQRLVASDDTVRAEREALAIQDKTNRETDKRAVLADDNVRLLEQENLNTQRLQGLDSRRRALLGLQTDVDSRSVQEAEQRLNDVQGQRSIDNAVRNRQTQLLGRQATLLDSNIEATTIQNARLKAAQEVRINAAAAVARADAQRAQDAQSESFLIRARSRGGFAGGFAGQIARGPTAGQPGGFGSFLGAGAASTLRFALPGAVLFGFARGITETVREAEELQQILVRLESQFESLGRRGVFGDAVDETVAAKNALDEYTQALFQVSRETGIATDATVELGQRFIGLFSSIGDSTEVVGLSEAAVRATSEFAVITGLPLEETFNDLAGGVRSFGETSLEISNLIEQFTDLTVAVSDATGVATGEIADFVGRLGPAAAQAGLEFEELFALGATALQGSGVGGAALAEQFNRILTGLQGELGTELGRLSIQFADVFAGIQLDDGRTVAELFNLQTIAAGEVDEVLIGLIQGFDSLTQAQQRQIIASIGSRREGATLATVLQNAATFTNALEATTNAAGERQERFADIIDRLTGQLAKLRVELVQLGLDIFNAGLEDVLSGILDALGLVVDAFQLLGSVLGFVLDVFSFLPDGFNQSVVIILSLAVGLKALVALFGVLGLSVSSVSIALTPLGAQLLYAGGAFKAAGGGAVGFAAALRSVSVAAAGAAVSLAAAFAPLAIITAAVLAFNSFRRSIEEANAAAAENRERIADLAPELAQQGDEFDRAAQRARNYASALSEVGNQEERLGNALAGPLGLSFEQGIGQIEDPGQRSDTREAFTNVVGVGADLDTLGAELASRQAQVAEVARLIDQYAGIAESALTDKGAASVLENLTEIADQQDTPEALRNLINALASGEVERSVALDVVTVFYNTATGEVERRVEAGQAAKEALQKAFQANETSVVEFFNTAEDISAITDPGEAVALALRLLPQNQEIIQEERVAELRRTIGFAREQFESGIIGQREFLEVARQEVGDLRKIVRSNVEAGNTGESAIASAKELRELEEEIAKAVVERAEADRDFLELIGSPLEGQELVQSLIDSATSDVQADSNQFAALVGDIIRAEQQIALDLIEGAGSVEEKLAIRDTFGLSDAASRLVTLSQIQLNEDVLAVINSVQLAAEELPTFFNDLATGVEGGIELGQLLFQAVNEEIARLEIVLRNLVADPEARAGVQEELSRLRGLAVQVSSAFVITGADVGLGLEEDLEALAIQERIEGFIEQAERQAAILTSLGQSDSASAARIRGLVAALSDPDLGSSGLDRNELLIELNDEINGAFEREGEKSQAFLDAINLVVGNTNLTAQEFASVGLIQGLSDQSQVGFVSLVNGYIAANTALSNSLISETLAAAEVYGFGIDQARSVFKAALERLQALLVDILVNTDLFGLRSGTPEAFGAEAVGVFNSIQRINELINDPRLGPAVDSLKNFTVNAAGGGGNTLGDLLEAERALARALVSNNPEELARLELAIADEELVAAENRVEELQALTQQVEARRNLEQVLNDVFNAETQLAIAVLESQGDVAGALALGVTAAEQNLAFLQNVGAGAAEIAAAELAVLNAQNAQQDGLVQAQLDELGFLFNIGDLSTQAYITALQEILNQLDPVADVDLWRRISLQIKGLKDSSNELQFNLPDSFDLPTLYEVRRLNQGSFGGADALQLGASTTDNRQYSIEINVQTGMDWDDARDILADALGADTNVFSLGTRRY